MSSPNSIPLTLTAVGSGRCIDLQAPGAPLVLIFHGREHQDLSRQINDALRRKYYSAAELIVATIIDLSIVPRMLRGLAAPMLETAYNQAVRQLKSDMPPADYLILLPDWKGEAGRALRIVDPNRIPGLAAIDRHGGFVGRYQGDDLVNQAVKLAERAVQASA